MTFMIRREEKTDFVTMLRASENYTPKLALVATIDEQIIDHIVLTKFQVQGESDVYETLVLTSLVRNQRIRTKLVLKSFELMERRNSTACSDSLFFCIYFC